MKKEEKKNAVQAEALNENDLENVSGGYVIINADGSRTLYDDRSRENLGTYTNEEDLMRMAMRFRTTTGLDLI